MNILPVTISVVFLALGISSSAAACQFHGSGSRFSPFAQMDMMARQDRAGPMSITTDMAASSDESDDADSYGNDDATYEHDDSEDAWNDSGETPYDY